MASRASIPEPWLVHRAKKGQVIPTRSCHSFVYTASPKGLGPMPPQEAAGQRGGRQCGRVSAPWARCVLLLLGPKFIYDMDLRRQMLRPFLVSRDASHQLSPPSPSQTWELWVPHSQPQTPAPCPQ